MPEEASRFLARVSRAAMVDSCTSSSRAISVVVRPTTNRRVRATRSSGAMAGWQQAKIRRSCSSATWAPGSTAAAAAARISSSTTINGSFRRATASERSRSRTRRRAAVSSHAPVFVGTPSVGPVPGGGLEGVGDGVLGEVGPRVLADEQADQAGPVVPPGVGEGVVGRRSRGRSHLERAGRRAACRARRRGPTPRAPGCRSAPTPGPSNVPSRSTRSRTGRRRVHGRPA